MRRVSIVVTCDMCSDEIDEEAEGASAVTFTVRGETREMDLCDECIGGSFLQEARPVTNRKKRGEHVCHCGKSYKTERGLSAHQTRAGHD